MAGIAGVAQKDQHAQVEKMLLKIAHRGNSGRIIKADDQFTLGAVWPEVQRADQVDGNHKLAVWDTRNPPLPVPENLLKTRRPFALAAKKGDDIFLARSPFGVRPLYYGYTPDGGLAFASEVKALLEITREIHEFPPGNWFDSQTGFHPFVQIKPLPLEQVTAEDAAKELRSRLEKAIATRIDGEVMGSWLSGGLDSSTIAALARPHLKTLHTFAGGLPGAPDLGYARQMAEALGSQHHEILLSEDDLLKALADVIYYLESFDALLVRSTIVNYLVSRTAADYVGSVFSGEGGDELFAGYAYLETIPDEQLPAELIDITRRLHNTALQRVDRSASASGLVPHVPFLDIDVAFYVMSLPTALKHGPEHQRIEKWILRKAVEDLLPDSVLWRRKAKFWEGAGVSEVLSRRAEASISDHDFASQRQLPDGSQLNTKEELMYYRIFKQHFGEFHDLAWMGRTKGAPKQAEEPA